MADPSENAVKQRAEILIALGELVGPIKRVVKQPGWQNSNELRRVRARYLQETKQFMSQVNAFARVDPNYTYTTEQSKIHQLVHNLGHMLSSHLDSLPDRLDDVISHIQQGIYSVPLPRLSTAYAACTPFSCYCLIRDICVACTNELICVDRYVDSSIFHRYLRDVIPPATVTILTREPREDRGRDKQRFDEFLDVSRLYAAQRGPEGYRLVLSDDFHGRYLFADGTAYDVSGSLKDAGAGQEFTIEQKDNSEGILSEITEWLASGKEVFGLNSQTHV